MTPYILFCYIVSTGAALAVLVIIAIVLKIVYAWVMGSFK